MKEYKFMLSGTAPENWPTETFFGILNCEDNTVLEILKLYPFRGDWGKPTDLNISIRDTFPMPIKIDMVWLSICEQCFYSVEHDLDRNIMEIKWREQEDISSAQSFQYIIIGMAPYGHLALWFYCDRKSVLIDWIKAEKVNVEMADFLPESPSTQLDQYCYNYIKELQLPSLPPSNLFDNYMKQFTYRYLPMFEHWDEDKDEWQKYEEKETVPELDYIEEALFDGTHDKLHDGGLMKYHEAGKPKKLAVKWHIKKSEYTAYLWFEDEEIHEIFDRFYGAHPDTKSDFMIRIDAEQNKYELALYRYGLKEPQVISESAYQLIVFKNKFEYFRSANYNQPRGAWIW